MVLGKRATAGTLGLIVACVVSFLPTAPALADGAATGGPTEPVIVTFESQAAANVGVRATVLDGAQKVGAGIVSIDANSADAVAIEQLPGVLAVEPDVTYAAADEPLPSDPADPCVVRPASCAGLTSGYLDQVGVRQLWAETHGATITLAVLDGGVDATNPDLVSKLVGPELDLTAVHDGPSDHGTSVASIAVASAGNSVGLAGVGWDVRLLSVKVLDATGQGRLSDVAAGVVAATDRGASVLNLSLSGPFTLALQSAVDYAVSRGVVVVAAAGNQGSDDPANAGYPARYRGVIAVGAVTSSDTVASFSNFGSWVDVYAPGVGLPGVQRDRTIKAFNGTSAAAPVVAGVAALLKAGTPSLTSDAMTALLHDTGARLGPAQHDASRLDATAAAAAPGVLPDGPNSPLGTLDAITRVPSGVRVRGWAIDPGTIAPVGVHVYVDGVGAGPLSAANPRADLGRALPSFGPNHGYEGFVAVPSGVHTICAYGINAGAGANGLLACKVFDVSARPVGSFDTVTRGAGGNIVVSGWAIDPERAAATNIVVTVDGVEVTTVVANLLRPDVALAYPDYGPLHGYAAAVPKLATSGHLVCVAAVTATAERTSLGCRSA